MTTQIERVYDLMSDGQWRTLAQIQNHVRFGGGIPSVSAALRRMRQASFQKRRPGTRVELSKLGFSVYRYRVVVPS